jgi:Tfp pilus assembly protein FimT
MTILDENDLIRLLNAIQELSEQLSQSRSMSISLHASAGAVKVCRLLDTGNLQSLD